MDPTVFLLRCRHVSPSRARIAVVEVELAEVRLVLHLYLREALLLVACIHDRHRRDALPMLTTAFRMERYVAADATSILGDLTTNFLGLDHLR